MRQRIVLIFIGFVFFILVFLFQKLLFILIHGSVNEGVSAIDFFRIFIHGLPIDMSVSGYLTIIPALLVTASVWMHLRLLKKIMNIYFCIVFIIISVITTVDILLYKHWGFHIDPVILFYLRNFNEVIASGSVWEWLSGAFFTFIIIRLLYYGYCYTIRNLFTRFTVPLNHFRATVILIMFTCALFLPIRGGVTVSTMNVSYAYFSDRMFLNHAAINPAFNFCYLLNKQDDFEAQYQFYNGNEAKQIFDKLNKKSERVFSASLLRVDRPNIILFILESFSFDVAIDSIIAPNMARFAKEGVFYEHFYANTFRTDRGLVSILSGYPAHPTTAILKYPNKTDRLPAFSKYLRANGYENQSLYYGGDINFANMRSYFVGSCGIQDIVSDTDFPVKKRLTKWGVPDKPLIERAYNDLFETKTDMPFLKIILTLSSHEPFDVPTNLFNVPFLNAINYTDECIGRFISDLKSTELWDNTLIIFISDHAMQGYPTGTNNYEKVRFHIPMVWIGGAVKQAEIISDYGSQNDLAATLLSQLRIDYSDFSFSKDMLNPSGRKFSFYSYVNGFCMIDSSSVYLYDNNQQKALIKSGDPDMEKEAKAFFQMMYSDLGNR